MLISFPIIFLSLNLNHTKNGIINWYLTIVWTAFFPIALTGLIGALKAQNIKLSAFKGFTRKKVIFVIPTIGKIGNLPALYRVIDSILENAPSNLKNFRIDIVTEEVSEGNILILGKYQHVPEVNLIIVPSNFSTQNHTKYKARANQYSMEYRNNLGENRNDVWVYHLDDDTAVRKDTISSIAEFIRKDNGKYHLAQGILTFPHQNSSSIICKLADSIRPTDDITKFYFFTKVIGTPLSGIHGEHLLVRSSVESSIGWDFGPRAITEDAEFALNFSEKYSGNSTFLNSATYGASPSNISDFIKQRRRWARGLIDLVFRAKISTIRKIPIAYMVLTWATGIFQNIIFILLVLVITGSDNTSPIHSIFALIWGFNFSYQLWQYVEGLRINLEVSNKMKYYPIFLTIIIPGMVFFSILESISTFLGLFDYISRKQGFVVINKPS